MTESFNQQTQKPIRQPLRKQMPTAETILWSKLHRKQIAGVKFRRQYGVGRFLLGFYCPAIEDAHTR